MTRRTIARAAILSAGVLLIGASLAVWIAGTRQTADSGDKTLIYVGLFGVMLGAITAAFVSTGSFDEIADRIAARDEEA